MLFVEFNAILQSYTFIVLVLVFFDTCTKLYFSKKITFKHILECICFPIVISLLILSILIIFCENIKKLVLMYIYVRRAYKFIFNTCGLSNEELIDCICKNFLKEDSLDIKFYVNDEDIHLE